MNYLDVRNTCRLLDSAERDSVGQVSVLATRIGYRTQFLDHGTLYGIGQSNEYLAVLRAKDVDGISSVLKACSLVQGHKIGFLVTETDDISKYHSFLSTLKSKYFIITHSEPNVVLVGYNGIIRFVVKVFSKSNLTIQIQKLTELSPSSCSFLEMQKSSISIREIVKDKNDIQIYCNISFNILEPHSLLIQRYIQAVREIFAGHQLELDWSLEYIPWYDFSLKQVNQIKLRSLYLSETRMRSKNLDKFHDLLKVGNYGKVICFNYTPDTDRFVKVEDTARIYHYLTA
jgi:hypothetical protein